jgi:glutamate-1-semialdehyde aminotransferase
MPLSVLAGRRDVMDLFDRQVFFYTTFGGEALSLAAAAATIQEMKSKNVPAYLAAQGQRLQDGYNRLAQELDMNYTRCIGAPCRSLVTFDVVAGNTLEVKSLVQQELIKRGVLWSGQHALSFSHQPADIDYTLEAYRAVLPILRQAVAEGDVRKYLRGEPVEPVFRTVTGNLNRKG